MKNLKVITLLTLCMTFFLSCQNEEQINPENSTGNLAKQPNSTNRQQNNVPWVYVMDARFSRETCQTGPGVCFQNGDGNILAVGTNESIEEVFNYASVMNSNSDIGVIAFKKNGNELSLVFSESLEEESLIISENTILSENISIALGVNSITILQGEYDLNFETFENGEVIIPIDYQESQIDQHSEYGTIKILDYPVRSGLTLEDFIENLNISENELQDYSISESNYTGIASAEHLIDGQIINVWHNYENEAITVFEATLEDGSFTTQMRINACGNISKEQEWWNNLKERDWGWYMLMTH